MSTQPPRPDKKPNPLERWKKLPPRQQVGLSLIALVSVPLIVVGILAGVHGSTPPTPTEPAFSGQITNYSAVDSKHLFVEFTITNNGTAQERGSCTIEATNPFGDFGFDIFSTTDSDDVGGSPFPA